MFKQTANFLRESCNELLFLSPDTGDVKFLHRTVYDYLSDNRLFVRNTPDHFDNDDFIDELSKLRCICILRLKHESCLELADTLESMVRSGIPSFYPIPWVLVCDSLLTSQIRSICRCNGLGHLPGLGVVRHLMITGFDGFICGELERLPFLAICEGRNWTLARHDNLLESALQRDCVADMRGLQGMSLRTILQCGGDPNAFNNHGTVNDYLSAPFGRPLASESLREKLRWCHHTHWEAWLYLQLKSCIGTRDPSKATTQVEQPWTAASLASKRKSAEIIELLLHYGASPCCLVCIEEHDPRQSPGPCTKVGLEELLNHIAPADSIAKLQGLRQTCAERIRIYNLRRNQRRRAVRSLIISEQNLGTALPQSSNIERELANATQRLRTWFFEGLLHLYSSKPECCICQQKTHDTRPALAIWCIECGDFSCLCLPCSEKHPAVIPTLEQPCETFDSTGSRCTKGHTSVFVVGSGAKARDNDYDPGFSDEYYDILSARHGIDQAASVVKEWYAKHPIKLDMSFEEVLAEMHQEGQDGIVEQASRSS
ncbi:hypothetical protein E2P81_ATG10263 [Venturia nashicola]|nr:hypothetical protein E2P81_ATG10263 [Venturia nashicola]